MGGGASGRGRAGVFPFLVTRGGAGGGAGGSPGGSVVARASALTGCGAGSSGCTWGMESGGGGVGGGATAAGLGTTGTAVAVAGFPFSTQPASDIAMAAARITARYLIPQSEGGS
ncbi:hypothetical protein SBA4_5520008 [Candidatus Sulfopaludibacter sp. SbA4]|nr:hypothetical protein SBA4_5520008 [Candidatus Sulfopaludibacter sp. SbA4]